jgi:hypothetical protein
MIRSNLKELRHELAHLSKALCFDFDDMASENTANTLKIKLSKNLNLILKFEVLRDFYKIFFVVLKFGNFQSKKTIDTKLQIERLSNQVQKKQKEFKKIKEKTSKQNYEKKTSVEEQERDKNLVICLNKLKISWFNLFLYKSRYESTKTQFHK